MSLSFNRRVTVAVVMSVAYIVAASGAECPSTFGGDRLEYVKLYDGPVSEMAALIPQDGGWKLGYRSASKKGFYLACHYGDKILEMKLPTGVKSCLFERYPRVLCR